MLTPTLNTYKEKMAAAKDECEMDAICISWLKNLAGDYGQNGETAIALLCVVQKLLEI